MRLQIISIFLLLSISVNAQTENLPTSIKVISYLSGDFRQGDFLGAHEQFDSLVYIWNEKVGYFVSDTIYNIHEIREFKNMDFSENLNSHSLLKRPVLSWIDKREISELLKEIDTSSYVNKQIIDTFYSDENKIESIEPFKCTVSRKYNIENFGYSYTTVCKDSAEISNFLNKLLISNARNIQHSGHMEYIEITLRFKTHTITIRQTDTGGDNMTWINDKSPKVRLINPNLNLIAYKLVPKYFAQRQSLLEFKQNFNDIFLRK